MYDTSASIVRHYIFFTHIRENKKIELNYIIFIKMCVVVGEKCKECICYQIKKKYWTRVFQSHSLPDSYKIYGSLIYHSYKYLVPF